MSDVWSRDGDRIQSDTSHVGGAEGREDFATGLKRAARENPAATVLIGLGVAWLFASGGRGAMSSLRRRAQDEEESPHHAAREASSGSGLGARATKVGAQVGEGALEVGRAAGEAGRTVSRRTSGAASAAFERVGTVAHQAADALSSAGSVAYGSTRSAGRAAQREAVELQRMLGDFLERRPWALGVLGLAAGAAAAFAAPRTRIEDEWLGGAVEAAEAEARALLSEQWRNVRMRADHAIQEITREARAQGFSEDKIAAAIRSFGEKLTNVASTATDGVSEGIAGAADAESETASAR